MRVCLIGNGGNFLSVLIEKAVNIKYNGFILKDKISGKKYIIDYPDDMKGKLKRNDSRFKEVGGCFYDCFKKKCNERVREVAGR